MKQTHSHTTEFIQIQFVPISHHYHHSVVAYTTTHNSPNPCSQPTDSLSYLGHTAFVPTHHNVQTTTSS